MPHRYNDGLSPLQAFHLIEESDSAKHLLAYGIRALETAAFIQTTRDPIMTMLSIGAEKLLKLGLGLRHVEDNGVWIPATVLKKDYRHDLIKMEAGLRQVIRHHAHEATHRHHVDLYLAAVDADPVWPALLSALNRYGQQGRFFYLDALAENPQREESPQAFWSTAEQVVLDTEPPINHLFQRMLSDAALADEFYKSLNVRVAKSLQRFWDLVAMAAVQGVLGERGKAWGHDIKLIGRQII